MIEMNDKAKLIAEKMAEPAFAKLKDAWSDPNAPRWLQVTKVKPTGVNHWVVRLRSGKEILLTDEEWNGAIYNADHAQGQPASLPLCCVTGLIAGDKDACGDCDPCGAWLSVPEPVKELMRNRDEWANKYSEAMGELDEQRQAGVPAEGATDRGQFASLRAANEVRQREWDVLGQLTLAYRGNELAGEVGEACNVIKKLERERLGINGSRDTVEHLAEELADVIICTDLIAMQAGIDLEGAVVAKFNASSEKVGLKTRMVRRQSPAANAEQRRAEVCAAVAHVLHGRNRQCDYPIYETQDDRGLDEAEYIDFAMDVLASLRSRSQPVNAIPSEFDLAVMKERDELRAQLEQARDYVDRAVVSYEGDPADNNFQRGFLAALEVVRDEAFSPLPSTELPHGVVGEAKEGPSNAADYGNSEREIRKRDLKARTDAISPQNRQEAK
jgi:NTP pyrophosphatase (non-canonical NTP hydrolase)